MCILYIKTSQSIECNMVEHNSINSLETPTYVEVDTPSESDEISCLIL